MKRLTLTLVGMLAVALPAFAQNADVTGTWDMSVTSPQGTTPGLALVLKKEGDGIVGTFTTPQGVLPVQAVVKDKAVTITFTVQGQNGSIPTTFSGTIDGDAMRGTADFGGRAQGEWSAKRSAAAPAAGSAASGAPVDVTGTWAFEVTMNAGSGTPTMTFKQDGEKLTGRYTGILGEAPLAGTIKGTAIEFTIDVDVQGTAVHIVYTGVAGKTSMKGSAKFSELGEGTFTATRK